MNKFGIEEKIYIEIIKKLKEFFPNTKLYMFGSRVKGTNYKYSDIDIAVLDKKEIPVDIIAKISNEFENSLIPYEIDIVDLNSISETFKTKIQPSLIELS